MLDVPSITFLANYLQSYPSTVLVVSHDRAFLNEVATDIIHQHSERLDYYKSANFGTIALLWCSWCFLSNLLTRFYSRLLLCYERRTEEERQARIRKPDGTTSTFTR